MLKILFMRLYKKININTLVQMQTYITHDNGGRPFKVVIDGLHVKIYKNNKSILLASVQALKIFIGKSIENKMTLFSGGYGPSFDGNSILLQIKTNKYIYIGSSIFEFTTYNEIITFISNVGNSDVPYPYAIDCDNTYYLLGENVVVHNIHPTSDSDPYDIYYDNYTIIDTKRQKHYKNFVAYYTVNANDEEEQYNLTYCPNPGDHYDFLKSISKNVIIEKKNGKKYELSKQKYCDIINKFGIMNGFESLNITKIISERL